MSCSGRPWPALLLGLYVLAGCGDDPVSRVKHWVKGAPEDTRLRIACAAAPDEALAPSCRAERWREGGDVILLLSREDGGFRRIRVSGERIEAADGAEPARVVRDGGNVGIAIGAERYAFPQTLLKP